MGISWAWATANAAAPTIGTILYHEPLQLENPAAEPANGPRTAAVRADIVEVLHFDAFGRHFELHVRRNQRLDRRAAAANFELLTGKVAGDPTSWVRLTRRGERLSGIVRTGGDTYAIEPQDVVAAAALNPNSASGADNAVFRLADVLIPAGTATCGADDMAMMIDGEALFDELTAELAADMTIPDILAAAGAAEQIEVGVVGDFEFFGQFGSSAEAEMMSRFNIVDGIYSEQLGIAIVVSNPTIFTSNAADPFTDETDASNLLDEVMDYRVANHLSLGLTHLLTGKNLDGTTVGIAVRGDTTQGGLPLFGACTSTGVGLSQMQVLTPTVSALVIAHEIGHNFGALHDGQAADPGDDPNPCDGTPSNFLMAPSLNGSATFSQCSLDTMQVIVDAATCLSPAPSNDIAATGPGDLAVGNGNQFDLAFQISNVGDGEATGVTAQLNIPAALTLVNLSAPQGSCDVIAADCDLGSLAVNQGTTVTATLTADTDGDAIVTLTAAADDDDDIGNNSATVTVSVSSEVDLSALLNGTTSIALGQAAQATISLANLSTLTASNVMLSVGSSSGITINGLTSAQGNCSQASCTLGDLNALTSTQITIDYTGDAAGAQQLTASVTGDDQDPASGNNSAQLTITVNGPPPASNASSGGGGGGSVGLLGLFALLLVSRTRRPRDR